MRWLRLVREVVAEFGIVRGAAVLGLAAVLVVAAHLDPEPDDR